MEEKNINNDITGNKYNKFTEEKKMNLKNKKHSANVKSKITEKNYNINNDNDFGKNSLSIRNSLNEKTANISKIFDEHSNKGDLLDEEESKDILLSLDFRKSTENDLFKDLKEKEEKEEEKDDQYLKPKRWKYKNKKNYMELDNKFLEIKNGFNKGEIRSLDYELNEKTVLKKIDMSKSKIKRLEDLKDIEEKNEDELKENIFKYRKIFKDNNSFYRCVIFSFFENMVLTNNIMFFKELLIEIDFLFSPENNKINELFQDDDIKNELESNIQIKLIKHLIYLLIKSMSENIKSSYILLLKIFLSQDEFDSSIILLLRYFLCFYINENKYKIYSKEEEIEIMDLLPQKYKELHISLQKKFELFYINDLLRLKSYDSKILYYLIPYFFDTNLNIIYYYPDSKNAIYQKTYGINKEKDLFEINLFFYKSTFNIYYTKKFYEFNFKILELTEEKIEKIDKIKKNLPIPEDTEIHEEINDITVSQNFLCENCGKEYNNEEKKENILKLCPECLNEEFKNDIYKLYIYYLQYVNHNNRDYKHQRDNYFYLILQDTEVKKGISLFKAMTEAGCLIYKVINEIKKDICLICIHNNTNKKFYYQLPCGCRLCSKQCFNKYLDIMLKKFYDKMCNNSYKRMIFLYEFCICGKKYFYDDLIVLYDYLKNKKRMNECQMIIKIVKNRWYWKCVKCEHNFDPFCLNKRLFLVDDKINKEFYKKQLKHLICSNCYDIISTKHQTTINCNYCQSEHVIVEAAKLNYQNKYPDNCTNS